MSDQESRRNLSRVIIPGAPACDPIRSKAVFHALHAPLFNELHTRPFPDLEGACALTSLVIWHEGLSAEEEIAHLTRLCRTQGVAAPEDGQACFYQDFAGFQLRWERHGEFSTYTFLRHSLLEHPFADSAGALHEVSPDWIEALPRPVLSGVHLELRHALSLPRSRGQLSDFFPGERLLGGLIAEERGALWSTYQLDASGFLRILLIDDGFEVMEAGRLVRSIIELEAYRMMLLLGLPEAKALQPAIAEMDRKLSAMTAKISEIQGVEDERQLLQALSELSAETEKYITDSRHRFNACQAYHALVLERLAELRESPVAGCVTIEAFLRRRVDPAYRTSQSARQNLLELAGRIDHASELLRTRINLQLESQNQALLSSMNERARQQLRLQQAVEGLSVAAITYAVVSLLAYVLEAMVEAGMLFPVKGALALAIPLVALSVWVGVRMVRGRAKKPGA